MSKRVVKYECGECGRACDATEEAAICEEGDRQSRLYERQAAFLSAFTDAVMIDDMDAILTAIAAGEDKSQWAKERLESTRAEMKRRDEELGLITVCAAGAMGFAMVVER